MKKTWLLSLILVCCAAPAWAAIAFDAASGNSKTATGTTLTIAHTATGTGTTGLMLALCGISTGGGTTMSSVTWDGDALTQLQTLTNSSDYRIDIWYRKAPKAGTFNVVATTSLAQATTCHVVTLTGVDQTTTFGTQNTATGSNSVPTVTVTTASGEWVADLVGWGGASSCSAVGADQTQRDSCRTPGSSIATATSTQLGSDGGVMSWAQNGAGSWGMIAVPVKAASTASRRPIAPMVMP